MLTLLRGTVRVDLPSKIEKKKQIGASSAIVPPAEDTCVCVCVVYSNGNSDTVGNPAMCRAQCHWSFRCPRSILKHKPCGKGGWYSFL